MRGRIAEWTGAMVENDLEQAAGAALAKPPQRIMAITLNDGRRVWLKRIERLSLRLRIQKGDPTRAFGRERAGLMAFAESGLPVPEILLEGADFLVLADAGPSLMGLLRDRGGPDAEVLRAFAAAGAGLGQVHRAGFSHGRPTPRDVCWDGRAARFIDLERFSPARHSPYWQAWDVVIFVQSCFSHWPDDSRCADTMLAAYAQAAPEGARARIATLAHRLGWLGRVSRLLSRLRPKSRELRAVSLTISRLTHL